MMGGFASLVVISVLIIACDAIGRRSQPAAAALKPPATVAAPAPAAAVESNSDQRELKSLPQLKFYTNGRCPYAQRTWIVLKELGVPYEHKDVVLGKDNKEAWFKQMNPNGKVPVVQYFDDVVYESNVCNEYLAETFQSSLMPADLQQRARMRIVMQRVDAFVKAFYLYLSCNKPKKEAMLKQKLMDEIAFLEMMLKANASKSSWFVGDKMTLADIALFPFVERAAATHGAFKKVGWEELLKGSRAFLAWYKKMLTVKSVQETMGKKEQFVEMYKGMLKNQYFQRALATV
ncbi:unnamed protein product [Vitrella brassicaformis CCMP3155]|uniref:Glutathione transferase n=1 Tax=Vitrella brassicaformis (strain CCMP3155) TaxID=1169540 RepID=A0A0G4EBN7_VITBC|nr:unnamed protein product [Vitrella brassicaformis CCMP3155]|eukprot:CEL92705.1 unnamed protein product [Vitrella brassicaformis CCMP3155]